MTKGYKDDPFDDIRSVALDRIYGHRPRKAGLGGLGQGFYAKERVSMANMHELTFEPPV
jgi:hypothetical protein